MIHTQVGSGKAGHMHSEKARAILEAYMKRNEQIAFDMKEARGHVMRNENGEVILERKFFFRHVERDWDDAANQLHKIACGESARWGTPKRDAANVAEVQMNGETFSGRDVCLVAHITHGTSIDRLRSAFGEEAVSRILGVPRTPIEIVKFNLLESQIAKLRDDAYSRRSAAWDSMYDEEKKTLEDGTRVVNIRVDMSIAKALKTADSIEEACERQVDELRKSAAM